MNWTIQRFAVLSAGVLLFTPVFAQDSPPQGLKPSEDETKYPEADKAKLASLDSVPGYGGLAFGAPLPASGFQLEQDRGALKLYRKDAEQLLVGPALLETILYYFFDGKFYGVAFHTEDGQDAMALKGVLIQAFGFGENSVDEGPGTIWIAKKNGLLFDLNTSTGQGSAFLFDQKLHDAVLTEQSESAKAAAKQLIQGKP